MQTPRQLSRVMSGLIRRKRNRAKQARRRVQLRRVALSLLTQVEISLADIDAVSVRCLGRSVLLKCYALRYRILLIDSFFLSSPASAKIV
jgi:hypothetical protein